MRANWTINFYVFEKKLHDFTGLDEADATVREEHGLSILGGKSNEGLYGASCEYSLLIAIFRIS